MAIASVQLPPSLESVPAARSCAVSALHAWGFTASLRAAGADLLPALPPTGVRLAPGVVGGLGAGAGDRLTVRVCDEEQSEPCVKHADAQDEGGRGLWLVEAIADSWGWEPRATCGKVVWFELAASAPVAWASTASVA